MNEASPMNEESLPLSLARQVDEVCDRFERAWINAEATGRTPRLEDYLGSFVEPARGILLRALWALEVDYRRDTISPQRLQEVQGQFADHRDMLAAVFHELLGRHQSPPPTGPLAVVRSKSPGPDRGEEAAAPARLGRYRILEKLGAGGFGVVYRGYDDDLHREVAIKVPPPDWVASPENAEAYLAEARVLARLDHPGIVPVYDVGRTSDGICYLVWKFVPGNDLRTRIKVARLPHEEAVEIVARVAEALHYAHQCGLVHRDIKPANILLDAAGRPVVGDFGLALRQQDFGTGPAFAGTPHYMSPEQARGEGHRVDARSDIFSLGVVLYELLSGQRPFRADSQAELLEQIRSAEPRPPRQLDDTIPKELDRICLKALAKRAADRYSTAIDLADDLRHWQKHEPPHAAVNIQMLLPAAPPSASSPSAGQDPPSDTPRRPLQATRDDHASSDSGPGPTKVVPKGLRSFDAADADFFLELLPGPRDRYGLPDSLRFWLSRIEARDAREAFPVGILYGPSGCGKSSLVKAGLLPHLPDDVLVVYVEATPQDTETWLVNGLRKRCPGLPEDLGLVDILAGLRRGQCLPQRKKVLLVLDQFEQWLHARRDEQNTELVQALRQCDGPQVQCLVLVRDDFGMAMTRFMRDLEVPIVEGHNFATVDLFDLRHARKVLAKFGRSFGALPEQRDHLSRDQERFLEQAVAGLAEDRKIICVRLALFAEMVKTRPWTPTTLKEVGGTQGLGVSFLEETLGTRSTNPEHKIHQRAVRAVLKALLPERGTDLKGHMRSHQELLQVAGYARRPREFDHLMHILDSELRLVTPTDPEGQSADDPETALVPAGEQCYQLTHDYLVPAIRDWLTRKQRETWRGRAELRLEERSNWWNAKPENRHLPALWEWVNILLFTRHRAWHPAERRLMRQAGRAHLRQLGALALCVALLVWGAWWWLHALKASSLVEKLTTAEISKVPEIVAELLPYRRWAEPELRQLAQAGDNRSKQWLHARLALLPLDEEQGTVLAEYLLTAPLEDAPAIRDLLHTYRPDLGDRFWKILEDPQAERGQRLRAALALTAYAPPDSPEVYARWQPHAKLLANELVLAVNADPHLYGLLVNAVRPARGVLVQPLPAIFQDGKRSDSVVRLAANIWSEFVTNPEELVEQYLRADVALGAILLPTLRSHRDPIINACATELRKSPPPEASKDNRDDLARRRANAGAALLDLGNADQIWTLLQNNQEDSRLRTYLIHRLGPLGIQPQVLVRRLQNEGEEVSARRALILCLGQFSEEQLPPAERRRLAENTLAPTYRDHPDPGMHSAAEWLLRRWKCNDLLRSVDDQLAAEPKIANRLWFRNSAGDTMVVLPVAHKAPRGWPSPGHQFVMATKEVTVRQFQAFHRAHPKYGAYASENPYSRRYSPDPDCPISSITWYEAAQYCRWLSDQEGLPESECCYPSVDEIGRCQSQNLPLRLPPNYWQRRGYRLPLDCEWEFACRADSLTTLRAHGDSPDMLVHYAWFAQNAANRTWPGGQKKPNDYGLFDMYGNVNEWTNNSVLELEPLPAIVASIFGLVASPQGRAPYLAASTLFPGRTEFEQDTGPWATLRQQKIISPGDRFALRGGSFNQAERDLRSNFRPGYPLTSRGNPTIGFRVVRTLPRQPGSGK